MKLLTVIVPTYKKLDLLQETIDSIFMQDYPNIELIITDDASPEFSQEFIETLIKDSPANIKNIQIIHHEQNIGTVKNLNYALKKAQGHFISLLAGDDLYYARSTLSQLISELKDKDIIAGNLEFFYEDKILTNIYSGPYFTKFLPYNYLYCVNLISGMNLMPGVVFTKSLIESLNFFDEQFTYIEDLPFWFKLYSKKIPIVISKYITVRYRNGGISNLESTSNVLKMELYNIFIKEIEKQNPSTIFGRFSIDCIVFNIKNNLTQFDTYNYAEKKINFISLLMIRIIRDSFKLLKNNYLKWNTIKTPTDRVNEKE